MRITGAESFGAPSEIRATPLTYCLWTAVGWVVSIGTSTVEFASFVMLFAGMDIVVDIGGGGGTRALVVDYTKFSADWSAILLCKY